MRSKQEFVCIRSLTSKHQEASRFGPGMEQLTAFWKAGLLDGKTIAPQETLHVTEDSFLDLLAFLKSSKENAVTPTDKGELKLFSQKPKIQHSFTP